LRSFTAQTSWTDIFGNGVASPSADLLLGETFVSPVGDNVGNISFLSAPNYGADFLLM
jgi:hypothetical protein